MGKSFFKEVMEKDILIKSQNIPSGINTYFIERGYDYVEYLGDFMKYKVFRARYFNANVIAPCPTILAKGHKFRKCRPGYEIHVVYDYLEKGKKNISMWHLLAIRIGLFFDNILCVIMILLIPDPDYGLLKKIKKISSELWEVY